MHGMAITWRQSAPQAKRDPDLAAETGLAGYEIEIESVVKIEFYCGNVSQLGGIWPASGQG